jgi:IclR family transcriptional regulator, KDG regulon repressor
MQDSWLNQLSFTALEISRSLGYRPEPGGDSQQR